MNTENPNINPAIYSRSKPYIDFETRKVKDGWQPMFRIGVQTFSLQAVEKKEHAEQFYTDMLKHAFSNLIKHAKKHDVSKMLKPTKYKT